MKKTMLVFLIVFLMAIGFVSAIEPLPKGSCHWIRPETEYRPERTFNGVWGRMSDGSIKCFIPGKRRTAAPIIESVAPVCHTETICNTEEVCKTHCFDVWKCDKWAHVGCVKSHFEEVCKEKCHNEIVCKDKNFCI